MERHYHQPYQPPYPSSTHYDRANPDRAHEHTYEQPQATPFRPDPSYRAEPTDSSREHPYGSRRESAYENREPTYGARDPSYISSQEPTYSSSQEPAYSRSQEDPYRPLRDGSYNPYEQPQPSPSQGPPTTYRTRVNTTRSGRLTTTFKAEPIPIGEGLRLNPGYFKTCPGVIKIIQIILGMVCLGFSTPSLTGCARFFLFVTATCYILTVLLCIIIILGVDKALYQIPWMAGELVYTAVAAVCFALASLILLAGIASYDWPGSDYRAIRDQYIGAGIFGLIQAFVYGCGMFFLFIDWKATRPVPPPRIVTTN